MSIQRCGSLLIAVSSLAFFGSPVGISAAASTSPARPQCSLNGALDVEDGNCLCDAPWSGSDCSVMNFRPVSFPQGYGMAPNATTWGGNILFDGRIYHLFASRMTNGCSLQAWTTNSRVDHAVSDNIEGPFSFKDVAINTWSHNPSAVALTDGTFAIFHIGDGNGKANGGKNCTGSSGNGSTVLGAVVALGRRTAQENAGRAAISSTIHVSKSLDGPWLPLDANTLPSCNNPSPFVHPMNGTIFVICGNKQLLRSDSITGPWLVVTQLQVDHLGGPSGTYEDAFLYIDRKGHFHSLWHVYNTTEHPPHGHDCVDSTVSAHAYSEDGRAWFVSPVQPYGTQIAMSSGDTMTVATRERPKLFFGEQDGKMTHVINGVCGAPACPDGPRTGCVDCKYNSWDYTLIAPLQT